jgi:hypothetical protein
LRNDQILDSWKEITGYLRRSRKTCIRWENEFGLPIHRLDGTPKARVFAYKGELDRWLEETLKGKKPPQKLLPSVFNKLTSSAKSKKSVIPILIVVFVVIAIVIWQLFPHREAMTASKIENSIAIISFENETGNDNFDHLQKIIPNLLITNLENTGFFYVTTWERIRDLLKQMDKGDADVITSELGFRA